MAEEEKRQYVSPAKEWDVFLSHASEDKPYVRAVADGLAKRGVTFLLDERDFVAGRSLRGQIDDGILNSYLGVLFVSSHFMSKRWTREEFDGFFTLEGGGGIKIIPVWLDVDVVKVTNFSPMLAARLAIRASDDPDETASEIARHLHEILNTEGGWGQIVRIDALNLPWVQRPLFLRKSLRALDDFMFQFWIPSQPLEQLPGYRDAAPIMVRDAILDAVKFDGVTVALVGRQAMVQLYERHQDDLGEWVFQLKTNDPDHQKSVVYVRCGGRIGTDDNWPIAPKDHLTLVFGYIVATGAMTLADGSTGNAVYIVAARVLHYPKLDVDIPEGVDARRVVEDIIAESPIQTVWRNIAGLFKRPSR